MGVTRYVWLTTAKNDPEGSFVRLRGFNEEGEKTQRVFLDVCPMPSLEGPWVKWDDVEDLVNQCDKVMAEENTVRDLVNQIRTVKKAKNAATRKNTAQGKRLLEKNKCLESVVFDLQKRLAVIELAASGKVSDAGRRAFDMEGS